MSYILIDDVVYPVDTWTQIESAKEALSEAGLTKAQVWAGCPDCPDTYRVARFVYVGDAGRAVEEVES